MVLYTIADLVSDDAMVVPLLEVVILDPAQENAEEAVLPPGLF